MKGSVWERVWDVILEFRKMAEGPCLCMVVLGSF